MIVKSLSNSFEVTFWNFIIILLSGLNWLKDHKQRSLSLSLNIVAWAITGFVIGLVIGYTTGL